MIHENLDTSFVNVTAMLGYLRRRQFVGNIRIESSGYEAEIFLLENNQIKAREYDHITGRNLEGEEALNRILNRTREPGGIIHVFQTIDAAENIVEPRVEKKLPLTENPIISPNQTSVKSKPKPQIGNFPQINNAVKPVNQPKSKPKPNLPDFPFDLSNCVETKAKQQTLTDNDWQTLMQLSAEILVEIDKILAASRINLSIFLKKICSEISSDYPFLNPSAEVFYYENGKIVMRRRVNARLFSAGLNEILRQILQRLEANPKFEPIQRQVSQRLLALIHHRKPIYNRFHITPQLERILGI